LAFSLAREGRLYKGEGEGRGKKRGGEMEPWE